MGRAMLSRLMILRSLQQFIGCHTGTINRVLHVVGFGCIGLGIVDKRLLLVLLGAMIQELGHWYQFARTKDPMQSPWHCLKPQLFFAYPLFGLIVLYVIFSR